MLFDLNRARNHSAQLTRRLGCIYTVAGTDAVFSVRKGTLEIRGSNLFFDAETCKALMQLSNGEEYSLIEAVDLPLTLLQGFPPVSAPGLLVHFHNGDALAISTFRITIAPQGRPFMHLGIRRPGSCSGRLVGRRARTDC